MNCPICYQQKFKPYLSTIDYSVSQECFDIIECEICGHKSTFPLPVDLDPYYNSESYHPHEVSSGSFIEKAYRFVRTINLRLKFDQLRRLGSGLEILDYGCGTGEFLDFCKSQGFYVSGYEPNSKAGLLTSKRGITMVELNDIQKAVRKYDIISLWHVLEHIPDLNSTVEMLKRNLRPEGRILIAVPNIQSTDSYLYSKSWAALDVPRHLHHFSPAILNRLFNNNGFVLDYRGRLLFDSFYIALLSEKYQKSGILGMARALIYGLSSLIFGLINRDKASSMVFVFRKHPNDTELS
ncbi:MAG: class I SAM-dependent methyltransferase [Bacteroidales bacterium]|nr:class I SAM-dependent methyltransferase [Bacteroidales bacterium]